MKEVKVPLLYVKSFHSRSIRRSRCALLADMRDLECVSIGLTRKLMQEMNTVRRTILPSALADRGVQTIKPPQILTERSL